jgi:hypothetical protein
MRSTWVAQPGKAWPLLALSLTVAPVTARMSEQTRMRLVLVAASGYLSLFALTLWQALRGQPITRPDAWTWIVFAAIAATVAIAVVGVLQAGHLADEGRSDDTRSVQVGPRPAAGHAEGVPQPGRHRRHRVGVHARGVGR